MQRGIIVQMAWDGGSGLFSDLAIGTFSAEIIDEFEASKPLVQPRNVETQA